METQNENTKIFSCRLPEYLIHELKLHCVKERITVQEFIAKIVHENLNHKYKSRTVA